MKAGIVISIGKWGGIYCSRGFGWRLCLGWIAFTFFPFDGDEILDKAHKQIEKELEASAYITRHITWSQAAFGKGTNTEGLCRHIEKELAEIRAAPTDLFEWIDVIILALDGAWRAGHSPEAIIAALHKKQAINREREWEVTNGDQPNEHRRS